MVGNHLLRTVPAIITRVVPGLIGLHLGGVAVARGAPDQGSTIDLSGSPASGVRFVHELSAMPENDVLQTWSLRIPEYVGGCYFSADGTSFPGNANRVLPWVFRDNIGDLFRRDYVQNPAVGSPSALGIFALFALRSGEVLAVLPLAGSDTLAWLHSDGGGELTLRLGTFGTAPVQADAPLLAWARGSNVYEAARRAWAAALTTEKGELNTNWRSAKAYPEPFRYLGWCTWEQYKKKIDSALLTGAMTDLENSGLPIRWMLVDDGHQQGTMVGAAGRGRLKSFAPDPQNFPEGWKPVMAMRRPDKIRWLGQWHAFLGLWENIDPKNDLGGLRAHLMAIGNGTLVPKDDPQSAEAFYGALIASVKEAGFDFVKIDVQTAGLAQYRGEANAVRASVENTRALERAVKSDLQGMINCMAQNAACVFNTRYSAVTRCSIDYHLGDAMAAKSHLLQSYANTLWLGQTVWPDHDMFHSSDPICGRMMAVSKALSGGPIYLSDAPKDLVAGSIRPLCYADGELLRPLAPAAPLPDSVFADVMNEPRAYRVIAPLANDAAAVVLYNLMVDRKSTPVQGSVTAGDYRSAGGLMQPYPGAWTVPPEGLVAYDWYEGRAARLAGEWTTTLNGFADRLVLLTPIRHGWSMIGRADKYLAPAAVVSWEATDNEASVLLHESGPLLVYSTRRPVPDRGTVVAGSGPDIWRIDLPVGQRDYRIVLKR